MTPERMADIHARAMPGARSWSASEYRALTGSTGVFTVSIATSFAIGRAVLDQVELLLIATDPEAQRQGLGRKTLQGFEHDAAQRGAQTAFLEVAASNTPALRLYSSCGWAQTSRRKNYYRFSDGRREDALIFEKTLHPTPS